MSTYQEDRERNKVVSIEDTIFGLIGGLVYLACYGAGLVVVIAIFMWAFNTVFG